ncbi:MAG: hypothetical protein ACREOI_23250 [bacterium]
MTGEEGTEEKVLYQVSGEACQNAYVFIESFPGFLQKLQLGNRGQNFS